MYFYSKISMTFFAMIVFLSLAPIRANASASSWMNGTVQYVSCVPAGGYCSVSLSSTGRTHIPACAHGDNSYVISLVNSGGGDVVRLLLSAKGAGWTVGLFGKGTCAIDGFQENIDYVQVH